MLFNFGFHSSILLIFFVHGLLFSGLLCWKAIVQKDRASGWLAIFIFVCTMNILPWMLGHAGWYFSQPYRDVLFYVPTQHFLLLGPLVYCYTQQLLNPGFSFTKQQLVHFLPGGLYVAYSAFMFVADKIVLQQPIFYADGHDRDLDNWYRLLGIISLSAYLILSLRYYTIYKRVTAQLVSFADTMVFRWVRRYLVALLLMQLFDLVFLCIYPDWGSFTAKWWYYFSFSVLFYYVGFVGYIQSSRPHFSFHLSGNRRRIILVSPRFLPHNQHDLNIDTNDDRGIETSIDLVPLQGVLEGELYALMVKVNEAMMVKEFFRDPELTLSTLATRLQTNASILSKVINRGIGLSFNDLVNRYRVEAVKKELQSGAHKSQTLLGVALDCGFNSKTTFNRVFKKHTGLSPRQFVEQLAAQSGAESLTKSEKEGPNHDLGRRVPTALPNLPQIISS